MREIKFRAWDGDKMISQVYLAQDGAARWKENGVFERSDVVMQYTGLKDKNGVEIYEGDVVFFSFGIPPLGVRAPIEFHDGSFFAITGGLNPPRCALHELGEHIGEFEVIGNIYENPELVEV